MSDAAAVSYLEMSDEEVLNAPVPDFSTPTATPQADTVVESAGSADTPAAAEADPVDPDNTEDGDEGATTEVDKADAEDGAAKTVEPGTKEGGEAAASTTDDGAKADAAPTPKEGEEAKPAEPAVDYKSAYEKLLAPFKANGREIAVKSVDDAIALMQMGANYNKKMAALKPNLKLMKLLENNGLLSEEKLGFLIDLEKKSPEAISKLIKDSGINPLDLDAEKAGNYQPKIHTVTDQEIDLDAVLEEIKDSPTYPKVIQLVGKEWDGASKQLIAQHPQLLKVIDGHMASGVYDLISKEMESERLFGRLTGLSDIDAYRKVGDAIQARGGFDHLFKKEGSTKPAETPVVLSPKPQKVEDPKLIEKRRAAAPTTKAAAPSSAPADFNPLAMSDEEFAKMADPRFR